MIKDPVLYMTPGANPDAAPQFGTAPNRKKSTTVPDNDNYGSPGTATLKQFLIL